MLQRLWQRSGLWAHVQASSAIFKRNLHGTQNTLHAPATKQICQLCGQQGHVSKGCTTPTTTNFHVDLRKERLLHIPVMVKEVLAALNPKAHEVFLDCTFGFGGHAREILLQSDSTRVLALDRDPAAYNVACEFAVASGGRVQPLHGRFSDVARLLEAAGVAPGSLAGVILDAGVSSPQLDDSLGPRGFSFQRMGPLDMRMDSSDSASVTAADIVNTADEAQLAHLLKAYGEEPHAKRIAEAVVATRRQFGPFATTTQLATTVELCLQGVNRKQKSTHPATRTFQALRVFVNDELNELEAGLHAAARYVRVGGAFVIITFHSLEARIAHRFKRSSRQRRHRHNDQAPDAAPVFEWQEEQTPSRREVAANARARSAALLAGIRVG
eukprot:m.78409 g.78409  ORF g.78409 m.78409 type:complete len:384 (+) comp16232_c0_seq2:358-1509(+)